MGHASLVRLYRKVCSSEARGVVVDGNRKEVL